MNNSEPTLGEIGSFLDGGLVVPSPIPNLREDVESLVYRAIDAYIRDSGGSLPTHIFVHPVVLKELIVNSGLNIYQPYDPKRKLHFHYSLYAISVEVSIADIREKHDFVLVGNANSYNDFIMEREILEDHL